MPWLEGIRDRLGHVEGTWSYLKCAQCGSAHLIPMPRLEIIGDLYPAVYTFRPDFITHNKFKRFLSKLEELSFYKYINNFEVDLVKNYTGIKHGDLLDVGCGTGDRLARFAHGGFNVRGIDIQPEVIEYIRKTLGYAADAGTLDTVTYPPDSFDVVTICWVIEHLLDVKSVIQKIHACLKPNGWIIAEVPLADSLQSTTLGRRWSPYQEAPRHLGVPSQQGIMNVMKECEFTDIKILPAGIFNCAGHFALSMIPNGTATHAYNNVSPLTHLPRLLAGMLTILYLPMALIESYVLNRPAMGVVIGRKKA